MLTEKAAHALTLVITLRKEIMVSSWMSDLEND